MRTRRRRARPIAIASSLALMTALALAGQTLAGGWASVAMTQPPDDVAAGTETTFELTVMQHGVTPVSWPGIVVTATNEATGETISAPAIPSGPTGHYTVALTFPSEGDWSIAYASGDLLMEGTAALAVGAALSPAPAPGTAPVADPGPIVAIGLLVLLFLTAFAALVIRDRRADRQVGSDTGAQPSPSGG